MRKIFRFKYEPCAGMCYAWCKALQRELRKMSEVDRQKLVNLMVTAHDQLCDNPEYSFGVDVNEEKGIFAAHFRTPEQTDLFASHDFAECVTEVCNRVLSTEIPAPSEDVCSYGQNGTEDLGNEILKFCADEAFSNLQDAPCSCETA